MEILLAKFSAQSEKVEKGRNGTERQKNALVASNKCSVDMKQIYQKKLAQHIYSPNPSWLEKGGRKSRNTFFLGLK